ncbi:hypothetical protein BN59_00081 [Legionella massiliensis]|uniref:Sel1 repeat family protein n=1 Tax=Legionella massiliensis TaxID=1034943 RepID=A0A078KS74_9GAMM|nr:hypothetical protein [Legionella massiliensis]CDZ75822.1 hypothetical protein BN59_00081 [Legionella massiliensis]CEE11560.1 hypothetical protein BN1094_00081 [Legionella massiliensis]
MALSPQFSSDFVIRAKAVSEAPDNYHIKNETLGMLMQMKALAASGDSMAQYRLAQIYPQNSELYLSWMNKAADQGFTNAMLALAFAHAEKGTASGIQQAARHVVKIFSSGDSFIKSEATGLMDRNNLLATEVAKQLNNSISVGKSPVSFFAQDTRTVDRETPDLLNSESPAL